MASRTVKYINCCAWFSENSRPNTLYAVLAKAIAMNRPLQQQIKSYHERFTALKLLDGANND
jgi:hypothetical protein